MSLLRQRPSAELTPEQKAGTGGSWATSQVDSIPKKSNKALFIALGALLVAGTAGAVIALGSGKKEAEAPPDSAQPAVSAAAAAAPPSPPATPLVAPAAEPEAAVPAPVPETAPAAPSASAAVAAVAPTVPVARPRAAAPKPAAPKPAATPAAATTGTAKKRRDFGY
jgi:hypothetical protein